MKRTDNSRENNILKKISVLMIKTAVAVLLFVTLNRIFEPKYINENLDGRITREYYHSSGLTDVVFLGPSTALSGISPKELWMDEGISSYVRANASQTLCISYYMAEDAVAVHKPQLICLDTTFMKFGDDFVEEPSTRKSLDGMRLSMSKLKCVRASMGPDEKMMNYIVPLFRFHTRWKELTWDDIRYAWYMGSVTCNGYLEDDEIQPAQSGDLVYIREPDEHISQGNRDYLNKLITLCRDNDIELFLFKTPAYSDNWSEGFDRDIEEIAEENGITYINFDKYNEEIGLDYSVDTPDAGSHLNSTGAVKFSKYLGKYIMENYDVSDRRSEDHYKRYWERKIAN